MKKVIFNDIIPFSGFKACAIWPWVFVRNECKDRFTPIDSNHEGIHILQQGEMYIVGIVLAIILALCGCGWWSLFGVPIFFIWYGLEYLVRWIGYGFDGHLAYKNISFEQEAYLNEGNLDYQRARNHFRWVSYLFKKSFVRNKNSHQIVKKE